MDCGRSVGSIDTCRIELTEGHSGLSAAGVTCSEDGLPSAVSWSAFTASSFSESCTMSYGASGVGRECLQFFFSCVSLVSIDLAIKFSEILLAIVARREVRVDSLVLLWIEVESLPPAFSSIMVTVRGVLNVGEDHSLRARDMP